MRQRIVTNIVGDRILGRFAQRLSQSEHRAAEMQDVTAAQTRQCLQRSVVQQRPVGVVKIAPEQVVADKHQFRAMLGYRRIRDGQVPTDREQLRVDRDLLRRRLVVRLADQIPRKLFRRVLLSHGQYRRWMNLLQDC